MKLSTTTVLYIIENSLSSVAVDLQGLGFASTDSVRSKVLKTIGCVRSMRINGKELTAKRYHSLVTYIKHLEELLRDVTIEGTVVICMVAAARVRLIDLRYNMNSIALDNNFDLVY